MDREELESRVERAEKRARQADRLAQGVMQSGVASIALSLSVMAELMLAETETERFPNERIQQLQELTEEDDTDLSETPEQEEMLDSEEDSDPDEED